MFLLLLVAVAETSVIFCHNCLRTEVREVKGKRLDCLQSLIWTAQVLLALLYRKTQAITFFGRLIFDMERKTNNTIVHWTCKATPKVRSFVMKEVTLLFVLCHRINSQSEYEKTVEYSTVLHPTFPSCDIVRWPLHFLRHGINSYATLSRGISWCHLVRLVCVLRKYKWQAGHSMEYYKKGLISAGFVIGKFGFINWVENVNWPP